MSWPGNIRQLKNMSVGEEIFLVDDDLYKFSDAEDNSFEDDDDDY